MHISRSDRRAIRRTTAAVLLLGALLPATTARGALFRIVDDPRNEAGAAFGRALAGLDGGFAVGAPGARVLSRDEAGVIQLFAANGTLLRTLQAFTPMPGAALGTALVADGDRLYAGAPGDQLIGVNGLGAVYVFDVLSGTLMHVVGSPDPDASTAPVGGTVSGGPFLTSTGPRPVARGFGRALAVADDHLVVGAPDSTVRGLDAAGVVYVFDAEGALVRTIQDPTPRAHAFFGTSVAVIGDALVVGAPGAVSGSAEGAGVVELFDAETGAFRRTLSAPISRGGAGFGFVVGELGGALFVSAPRDRAAGAVYLFGAGATRLDRVLTPPTSTAGQAFGRAVLAVGGDLLVGADGAEDGSGEAFLVEPITSAVVARFFPATARAGGRFGFALAAAGPVTAIGEPATDVASAVGRVYLFGPSNTPSSVSPEPTEPGATVPSAVANAPCPLGATATSIDCRLAVFRGALRDAGLRRLTGRLRRAERDVRRADGTHGSRRTRALGRAARGLGEIVRRLASGRESLTLPAGTRDALVAEAGLVRSDLMSLAESGR